MVKSFVNLFLKLLSIGTVAIAAFLWADARVDGRPKSRDEQTLIGGMIWSQLIILMGLVISDVVGEELNLFVHAYFLISGSVLCGLTSVILVSTYPISFYPANITNIKVRMFVSWDVCYNDAKRLN